MFRCPCCAKVWKLSLSDGRSLLISHNMDRLWITQEPVHIWTLQDDVKNDLAEVGKALEKDGVELAMKGDNYVECHACHTWSKFEAWHQAWKFPGDFFDADQLCKCGGELWYDKVPGTTRYALVCEECGWAKKNRVISGHAAEV